MIELLKGTHLIEASAGTGKTYTLCSIVLRLVLEKQIPINEIVAVTFTKAATEELSFRIRQRLQQTLLALQQDDPLETELAVALQRGGLDRPAAQRLLRQNIELFEDAPISTIHGFCKRALDQAALESGISLDAKLEGSESTLIEGLRDEFFRIHILERSPLLSAYFGRSGSFLQRLKTVGQQGAAHPYAQLRPPADDLDLQQLDTLFQQLCQELADWLPQAEPLAAMFGKRSRVAKLLRPSPERTRLQKMLERGFPLPEDLDLLKVLTEETWSKALLKKHQGTPPPPVLATTTALAEALPQAELALLRLYRRWLLQQLGEHKERRNVLSYNDLLHLLNRALQSKIRPSVAQTLGRRYKAALIDEFQDTDQVQLNIIRSLFGRGEHYLFFIGDPKQAIYRFRGADVFAYFKATRAPELQRHRLDFNYRSHPQLIEGLNHLFLNARDGFVFREIDYSPVQAGRSADELESVPQPLRISLLAANKLNKATALPFLAQRAADDFARRVEDLPDHQLGKFAFLVNTGREADALLEALAQRGIPGIISQQRSVFQTEEQGIMLTLLEALSRSSRLPSVNALLLSPCFQVHWSQLFTDETDRLRQDLLDFLAQWAEAWFEHPFSSVFQRLLREMGISKRLLAGGLKERAYANLHQLAELMDEPMSAQLLTPAALKTWLARQRHEDVANREEWQVRLSTDAGKPQIVTIHTSKGLQYPHVICPFLSLMRVSKPETVSTYHLQDDLVIDLQAEKDGEGSQLFLKEERAELTRLIYVALTRAMASCTLYLTEENIGSEAFPSGFAMMLLGFDEATARYGKDGDITAALGDRLASLAAQAPQSWRVSAEPPEPDAPRSVFHARRPQLSTTSEILARPFQRSSTFQAERILSFTALARGRHGEGGSAAEEVESSEEATAAPDPLADLLEPAELADLPPILELPKGPATGDLLHYLLERADFQSPQALPAAAQEACRRFGFSPSWSHVISDQLQLLLQLPLSAPDAAFSLGQIPPNQRRAEMEFAYPAREGLLPRLARVFRRQASPAVPPAWIESFFSSDSAFHDTMMRGFIDLAIEHQGRYYLIDWKSNYLGHSLSDYHPEQLPQAMADHHYYLQYALYLVALKRQLARVFPAEEVHARIGGVFYIFIRGLLPETQNGIFFDQPSKAFLDQLDAALADT